MEFHKWNASAGLLMIATTAFVAEEYRLIHGKSRDRGMWRTETKVSRRRNRMMTFVEIWLKPRIASIGARWDDVVPIGCIAE